MSTIFYIVCDAEKSETNNTKGATDAQQYIIEKTGRRRTVLGGRARGDDESFLVTPPGMYGAQEEQEIRDTILIANAPYIRYLVCGIGCWE